MKTRFSCMFFAILMLFTLCLTSCGGGEPPKVDPKRPNTTLSFWIPTDERTTEEAVTAMQNAFNDVTKVKYSTQIIFNCIPEDEYKEKLDAKFEDIKRIKDTGSSTDKTPEGNDSVLDYPELSDTQLDIVIINSKAMYDEYIEKGYLSSLTEELKGDFKSLTKMVNDDFLNYTKRGASSGNSGLNYGIPNNVEIGEYTYMLVNKDLAQKYHFATTDMLSVGSAYGFVSMVAEHEDRSKVAPVYAQFDYPALQFLGSDFASPSILGSIYPADEQKGEGYVECINLLTEKDYCKYLMIDYSAKSDDWFYSGVEDTYAFGVVQGDYNARHVYAQDYHVTVVDNPRWNEEDIYASLFAIPTHTVGVDRSLEIIDDLLSDEELINILTYGDPVNYVMKNDGVVEQRLSNEYYMNPRYTGSAFHIWPCANLGQIAGHNDVVKLQTRDLCSPVFYDVKDSFDGVSPLDYQAVDAYSMAMYSSLYDSSSVVEFEQKLDHYKSLSTGGSTDETELLLERMADKDGGGTLPLLDTIAGSVWNYYMNYN